MSNSQNPLEEVFHEPTAANAIYETVQRSWKGGAGIILPPDTCNWDACFAFYDRECSVALINEVMYQAVRTHANLLQVASLLTDGVSHDDMKESLHQRLTQKRSQIDENRMLEGSIKLVARMFAMINIDPLPSEVSGKRMLPWTYDSLQDTIHNHFDVAPEMDLDPEYDVIGADFTCHDIERLAGSSGADIQFG